MNLIWQTLFLTGASALSFLVPIVRFKKSGSGALLLFGMGGLLGFCLFDLWPELLEKGGAASIVVLLVSALLYVAFHFWGIGHHHHHPDLDHSHHGHDCAHHSHLKPVPALFYVTILLHACTDGMLLGLAHHLSKNQLERGIFFTLLAHKIYEAFSVSAVVANRLESRAKILRFLLIYLASFPVGVWLAADIRWLEIFHLGPHWVESAVPYVVAFTLGSLWGCLLFDLVLPIFRSFRRKPLAIIWFVLGLAGTFFLTRFFAD